MRSPEGCQTLLSLLSAPFTSTKHPQGMLSRREAIGAKADCWDFLGILPLPPTGRDAVPVEIYGWQSAGE